MFRTRYGACFVRGMEHVSYEVWSMFRTRYGAGHLVCRKGNLNMQWSLPFEETSVSKQMCPLVGALSPERH